ncbi:MAG: squalene/phytoene synthase family protein [Neomegalonema sp.]|nr:squalene/phytoene synthase family protein [Neomegalonema sp.]
MSTQYEQDHIPSAPPGLSTLGEILRLGDPDRFEATLFAEEPMRERLFTLYAFNLELARASWRSREPHIVLMRLQWWRDVVADAVEGKPPRQHEVAAPLAQMVETGAVDLVALEAIMTAREAEAEPEGFVDRASFDAYIAGAAGALMTCAAQVAAGRALTAFEQEACAALGRASGVARLLEATPKLAAHGKCLLPLHRADRAALLGGETTAGTRDVVMQLCAQALALLRSARASRLGPELRPALLSAWRAERMLKAGLRPDHDIFMSFGPESPFRRRASLLWRALVGGL